MNAAVISIEVDRPALELRLAWDDDFSAAIPLVAVRLACPCAGCRGARGNGDVVWPGRGAPQPLEVQSAELVGAWGMSFAWNDGHEGGIYPFETLRRWGESGVTELDSDSGLAGA